MHKAKVTTANMFQVQAFYTLAVLLSITMVLYGYFLNKTINAVVFVSDNQKHMSDVRSELSTLESEYLTTKDTLTMEKAKTLGFIEAPVPTYVKASLSSMALTLNSKVQ